MSKLLVKRVLEARCETKLFEDVLQQIADIPRGGRSKRLAMGVLDFVRQMRLEKMKGGR